MGFLQRMSLSSNFVIMLSIPLLGLLFFSTQNLQIRLELSNKMDAIEQLSELSVHIASLLHETQKERGMSAGFIGSQGKNFASELSQQRSFETTPREQKLRAYLKNFDSSIYGLTFSSALSETIQKLNGLDNIRQQVDQLSINETMASDYYTQMNAVLLNVINHISKLTINDEMTAISSAYLNFLKGKERAGIERALLTSTFAKNAFEPGMYLKLSYLISEQNTFFNQFVSQASSRQVVFFNEMMKAPSVAAVQQMRNKAIKAGSLGQLYFLLGQLYQNMSLRGAYHSIKNLLIRGSYYGARNNKARPDMQTHYKRQFERNYQNIKLIMEKIFALSEYELSKEQRKDVEIIWQNIHDYQRSIDVIITSQDNGQNINQIDYNKADGVKVSDKPAYEAIQRLVKSTTAGQFGIDPRVWFKAITNKINLLKGIEDRLSKEILDRSQALKTEATTSFWIIFGLTIFSISIFLVLAIYLTRQIISPIKDIIDTANAISNGQTSARSTIKRNDELGKLADSFNKMAQSNEDQYYSQSEIAKILELFQREKDIKKLSQSLISKLASSFGVGYGAIYILNEEMQCYKLLGSYGYSERKHICNSFKEKEGLAGQCAFEKKLILLNNVPEDHIRINSGLGESSPLVLLEMPAIHQDKVYAVLELASYEAFTEPQQAILDTIMPSFAISLESMLTALNSKHT